MAPPPPPLWLALLLLAASAFIAVQGFQTRLPSPSTRRARAVVLGAAKKSPKASSPPPMAPARNDGAPPVHVRTPDAAAAAERPAATTTATTHDDIEFSVDSPFHCLLEDELGRPRSETRPRGDGRSWHASLAFPSAQQILADASRLRSVSKDMLQDALHLLEYMSLHPASTTEGSAGSNDDGDADADLASMLDGTWRLAFDSGGAFPLRAARSDRWGYLKDEVEVSIRNGGATILVEAFAKRFEGTLAPVHGSNSRRTLALDFSRVQLLNGGSKSKDKNGPASSPSFPALMTQATQRLGAWIRAKAEGGKGKGKEGMAASDKPLLAPGELKVVNALLRPGARLHLISVAASHLALRFTPAAAPGLAPVSASASASASSVDGSGAGEDEEVGAPAGSSLLVFERTATATTPSSLEPEAAAEAAAAVMSSTSSSSKKKGKAPVEKEAQSTTNNNKPRFKKPLKGTPSNPYSSMWEYLEEEAGPLFLAATAPTFLKILPPVLHAARFKLMLLQELWVAVAQHLPNNFGQH